MNDCPCKKNNVETQYIGELPVFTLSKLPDFLLCEIDTEDEVTGNTKRSIVRVPSDKLFASQYTGNLFAIEANNAEIEIPDGEVRAIRVVKEANLVVAKYADATHPATMLAIKKDGDMLLCMASGYITLPKHEYIIGAQYVAGENGEPVTGEGQKLFTVVSDDKLVINL